MKILLFIEFRGFSYERMEFIRRFNAVKWYDRKKWWRLIDFFNISDFTICLKRLLGYGDAYQFFILFWKKIALYTYNSILKYFEILRNFSTVPMLVLFSNHYFFNFFFSDVGFKKVLVTPDEQYLVVLDNKVKRFFSPYSRSTWSCILIQSVVWSGNRFL